MYTLLIVDDEYEIRNGLSNLFPWHETGFQVQAVRENGREALDYIIEHPVDVVLCDIMMPELSGIELARELRDRHPRIKIVFLSGYRDFEYARKALSYGVRNYIVKPTKYSELSHVFHQLREELDEEQSLSGPQGPDKTEAEAPREGGLQERIIARVRKYIDTNCHDASLEKAADLVRMNPHYLSKLYKQVTGVNFSDHLLGVKMDRAAELLRGINYRTHEISRMLGYSSPKSFSRAFKQYYGMSPREFRNSKPPVE
ncbi:response regulator [Marispirochaeta aestuarii]|uniref:response regulator transcription factor n=1 Tax=Marispirochaeta aestuarii TaxID=1963862 RepID=UPI0029C7ADC1|nr:response regulator [Marispirochaeta aestuarii]